MTSSPPNSPDTPPSHTVDQPPVSLIVEGVDRLMPHDLEGLMRRLGNLGLTVITVHQASIAAQIETAAQHPEVPGYRLPGPVIRTNAELRTDAEKLGFHRTRLSRALNTFKRSGIFIPNDPNAYRARESHAIKRPVFMYPAVYVSEEIFPLGFEQRANWYEGFLGSRSSTVEGLEVTKTRQRLQAVSGLDLVSLSFFLDTPDFSNLPGMTQGIKDFFVAIVQQQGIAYPPTIEPTA